MQGRVDQPHPDREAIHRLENAYEISPLVREKLVKGLASRVRGIGDDHFLNRQLPVKTFLRLLEILEEHVLCPAQTDSLSSHLASFSCIMRRVGVGSNAQPADAVCP